MISTSDFEKKKSMGYENFPFLLNMYFLVR